MLCPHPMSLNGRSTVPILSRPQQARPPAQRVRSSARMRQELPLADRQLADIRARLPTVDWRLTSDTRPVPVESISAIRGP